MTILGMILEVVAETSKYSINLSVLAVILRSSATKNLLAALIERRD
jgi:hypothetical protein